MNDMLFAKAWTPIIMLPVEPHVDFYYEHLAASLDLKPFVHLNSMRTHQRGRYKLTKQALEQLDETLHRVVVQE